MPDDSWRDGYDKWKLRSPDDDRPEEPECDHEGFHIDILTGRAECDYCAHTWLASSAEILAQQRHEAEYADLAAREARRDRWLRWTFPIRWRLFRLLSRIWPRKALKVLSDDEIPF